MNPCQTNDHRVCSNREWDHDVAITSPVVSFTSGSGFACHRDCARSSNECAV